MAKLKEKEDRERKEAKEREEAAEAARPKNPSEVSSHPSDASWFNRPMYCSWDDLPDLSRTLESVNLSEEATEPKRKK